MKRSEMSVGADYAVHTFPPVPLDPYSDTAAAFIRRGRVRALDRATGRTTDTTSTVTIPVTYSDDNEIHHVSPRAVVCLWDDYVQRLAERQDSTVDGRRSDRLDREAQALNEARAAYGTARLVEGCIVVTVDDWLRRPQ